MKKLINYFITILKHKYYVLKYCIKLNIIWRGIVHDLSKFSTKELFVSAKYWAKGISPITREKLEKGYSKAWLHHKGRNRHHLEYWLDISNGEIITIRPDMDDVKEMFADWIAATIVYNKGWNQDNFINYWEKRTDKEFMHKDVVKLFNYIYAGLKNGISLDFSINCLNAYKWQN